jgi:hypothetical protein
MLRGDGELKPVVGVGMVSPEFRPRPPQGAFLIPPVPPVVLLGLVGLPKSFLCLSEPRVVRVSHFMTGTTWISSIPTP